MSVPPSTPTIRPFAAADRERWDGYVRRATDSHFGQLTAWMDVMEEGYGCRPRYWLAEREAGVCGVLPLFEKRMLTGRGLFSAPGGLLADDEAAAKALLEPARELLERRGWDLIELRDQRRRWPGLVTVDEHVTMELELGETPERLWSAFDAKLRNQIRKGEKSGFTTRWGPTQVGCFYRVMIENMRDLGTPILGEDYFRLVLDRLGEAATVLVIDAAGEPAGAMFLVEHRDTLVDPWASSLRRHFDRCPNQVLYWAAIRHGIARGLRRFDFGRSQPGSGTYRFKEQWRARPVPLYYQYVLGRARRPPSLADQKHAYALAVRVWKRLPIPVAGALGRRVKRWFPEAL